MLTEAGTCGLINHLKYNGGSLSPRTLFSHTASVKPLSTPFSAFSSLGISFSISSSEIELCARVARIESEPTFLRSCFSDVVFFSASLNQPRECSFKTTSYVTRFRGH
jgi:hypothetical protein